MVKVRLNLMTIAIGLACLLAIAYDGVRLRNDLRFNQALETGMPAGGGADPPRQFAQAYDLQQQWDFDAAVKAYAAIRAESGSRLSQDVNYNLANLFFREALKMLDAGDDDRAMPLIEMAKQNYTDVLRIDGRHWDAKYNLELALVLAPETDPVDDLAERNPERSPRAISKMQAREPLP